MRRSALVLLVATVLAGCGSSASPPSSAAPSTAPSPPSAPSPSWSLPPGAQPGLDDYDGDGTPDPTCGTQDFGGGLVLLVPCRISNAHEPEHGTRLVKDSLYRLPGPDADLTGISGELVAARDTAGVRVFILVFNSDGLFATGSDAVASTDTLDATIRFVNATYPGGAIQIRGHTDATGTASANQALSERRAATVRAYVTGHGIKATATTSVGLGGTRPLVEETNPEGTPSDAGRAFNRRVELVVRRPA